MEHIVELLCQTKLFRNLPPELIRSYIVPAGKMTEYQKDSYLFFAQQKVDSIQILIQGKVNILYYYADGSYSLAETVLPMQVLGLDLIATKSGIAPYYALAAEQCLVFSFSSNLILRPGRIPEVSRQLFMDQFLIMLSHLLMKKEKHLITLSRNGLRERIMTYLSLQAQQKKENTFTVPFSREEMAAYLCVNRSSLSHELSLMRKEGLIDFYRNRFTLLQNTNKMK